MTFLDADAKALEHALRRDGFLTGSARLVMTGLDQDDARAAAAVSSQRTVTIEGLSEDGALRLAEVFIPLLRSTGGHITITWTVEQGAS